MESSDGEVAVGSIEYVADGVRRWIFWPQGLLVRRLFACRVESRGGHTASAVSTGADLRLVIGDPVADFELHHLALAVRTIETAGGIQGIRCLLLVLEPHVSAHCPHTHPE